MSILCSLGGHPRPLRQTWNNGLYFGVCPRCRADIIRAAQGRWYALPPRTKVTWRRSGEHCMEWWEAVSRAHAARSIGR